MADTKIDQFDDFVNEKLAGKSDDDVAKEMAVLDLEDKRLSLELKRRDVGILRGQIQQQKEANAQKMASLRNFMAGREATQARCNHRKGGTGAEAFISGQGASPIYCVIKHKMPNNTYSVFCQRCGKEWHAADEFNVEGGVLVPRAATPGWSDAVQFVTDNTSSGSGTFNFTRTK